MKPFTISGLVLGLIAFALSFASATPAYNKRHHELANRARGDVDIHERSAFVQARFTYYDVGLGACGWWSEPGDFIVALNVEQFGPSYPGEYCGKKIAIWVGVESAVATIVDKCMGCPWAGLDFSVGLFTHFAAESVGVLQGVWYFLD